MTAFSLTVILLNEPLVISDAVLYKKMPRTESSVRSTIFTNYKLYLEFELDACVQVVVDIVRDFCGVVEIYAPVGIDVVAETDTKDTGIPLQFAAQGSECIHRVAGTDERRGNVVSIIGEFVGVEHSASNGQSAIE